MLSIYVILLAVQKIELVGGESWLEHNSVAVAAITAAALAALVAILNQRAQLKHDRYLRNRDHIRDTLDNAILIANEMRTAVDRFLINVRTFEDHRDTLSEAAIEAEEDARVEEREKLVGRFQTMQVAQGRLEIRLEQGSSIPDAYGVTLSAFASLIKEAHMGIRGKRSEVEREGDDERKNTLESAFSSFQEACQDWFADRPRRKWTSKKEIPRRMGSS